MICLDFFPIIISYSFLFTGTSTTEISTLSLHDALPIFAIAQGNLTIKVTETPQVSQPSPFSQTGTTQVVPRTNIQIDRKSTRLNSSHVRISYAVFCLKKKNNLSTNSTTCKKPRLDTANP